MPTKVELLRCAECGHTLTREKFDQICFDDCIGKDHYIGLIGDGKCPECGKDVLEDCESVTTSRELLEEIRDFLSAPQRTPDGMETHRAESEGVDHLLSGVIEALGGE